MLYDLYIFILNNYVLGKLTYTKLETLWIDSWPLYHKYSTNFTFLLTIKLMFCLTFLIFIRGGVPRYRYDFLTKIGWIKFLGYVLAIFVTTLILCIII